MKKFPEIKIVSDHSRSKVEEDVNVLLYEGWNLLGPLDIQMHTVPSSVTHGVVESRLYTQTLTRMTQENEDQ